MEQNRRRRDLLGVRCTFPRVKNCFLRYEKDVSLRPKGLDLIVTRPLAVSLSEIAVEDKTASKISGQFRKAKLRRGRGSTAVILSSVRCPPALLRVTIQGVAAVLYVAFLPFFPQVSAGAQKKRLCRF